MIATKKSKLDSILIFYIFFYLFWGFLFRKTVFSTSIFVYVSFVLLVFSFAYFAIKYKCVLKCNISLTFLPFLLYILLRAFIEFKFEIFSYWFDCLLILYLGFSGVLIKLFPYKLIISFGIIALIGIAVQMVFSSFYNNYFATLFVNANEIIAWEKGYGFSGFTYQIGTTAEILTVSEAVSVSLFYKTNKKKRFLLLTILFILGIALTGKRTLFFVSIVIPLFIAWLLNKSDVKKIITCFVTILLLCLVYLLLLKTDILIKASENPIFGRFAKTLLSFVEGHNSFEERSDLINAAVHLFLGEKLLGIGLGNFPLLSGFNTDVHNVYLQVLCELGIVGFVLYLVPVATTLLYTFKVTNKTTNHRLVLSLFIQLFYLLNGLTENSNVNLLCFILYFYSVSIVANEQDTRLESFNYEKNVFNKI